MPKAAAKTRSVPMDFAAEKDPLADALARVRGAVERRTTMPILSHVKVEATRAGAVAFTATDLELRASTECSATVVVGGPGTVCVPADLLAGALSGLRGKVEAELSADGLRLFLADADRRFEIACLPPDDFPDPADRWQDPFATFEPGRLPGLLRAVRHGSSTDESRYNLCGVYFAPSGGDLAAVATDGHRLSLAAIAIEADQFGPGLLVPSKAAGLLAGMAGTIEAFRPIEGEGRVLFATPGMDLAVRLVDGEYPDYRRVIPQGYTSGINIDAAALLDAVEAVAVVGDGKSRAVTLSGNEQDLGEALTVSALGELGVATATVPCMGGAGFRSVINSKYLAQALKSLDGEIMIRHDDPLSPLLLEPVEMGSWTERIEVLMPMRM